MYKYKAELVRVIDGDTIDFKIDLGFFIYVNIRVRLKDYDAPEVRGPEKVDGAKVRDKAVAILENTSSIIVETTKTGKYGRWLGDVLVLNMVSGFYENLVTLLEEMENEIN